MPSSTPPFPVLIVKPHMPHSPERRRQPTPQLKPRQSPTPIRPCDTRHRLYAACVELDRCRRQKSLAIVVHLGIDAGSSETCREPRFERPGEYLAPIRCMLDSGHGWGISAIAVKQPSYMLLPRSMLRPTPMPPRLPSSGRAIGADAECTPLNGG